MAFLGANFNRIGPQGRPFTGFEPVKFLPKFPHQNKTADLGPPQTKKRSKKIRFLSFFWVAKALAGKNKNPTYF